MMDDVEVGCFWSIEALRVICYYLDDRDLLALSGTCKLFHKTIVNGSFWSSRLHAFVVKEVGEWMEKKEMERTPYKVYKMAILLQLEQVRE